MKPAGSWDNVGGSLWRHKQYYHCDAGCRSSTIRLLVRNVLGLLLLLNTPGDQCLEETTVERVCFFSEVPLYPRNEGTKWSVCPKARAMAAV